MFYRAVAATCPGNSKEYNSNNIYLNSKYITEEYKASEILLRQKKEQEGLQFYAISEGFGADRYEDEASLIAMKKLEALQKSAANEELSDDYDKAADALYSYIDEFIKTTQEAVTVKASKQPDKDIHASIAVLGIYENALITCNLGNTKIFLFRKGKLSKLSEEHNYAYMMYKNGIIDKERLANHSKRNKLTQYLGILPEDRQPEPYFSEAAIKHGDIFLICNSTFCENVSEEALCEMVKESKSLSQIVDKMMSAAAEKGFENDTSVMVIRADSHEKAAAVPVAAGGVAAGTAAKTASAAAKGDKKEGLFADKVKKFLGLSSDAENEKIWPALITFACCILVVIVLAVLGVKIYNASKESEGGETKAPAAASSEMTPTPTVAPTSANTEATPTATATDIPTSEITPTPTATVAPTQEPTVAPTDEPTATPDDEPTATPDEEPTATPDDEPTATPDDEPTATPDGEPTATPDGEPTATPDGEPTATPDGEPTATPDGEPTAEQGQGNEEAV